MKRATTTAYTLTTEGGRLSTLVFSATTIGLGEGNLIQMLHPPSSSTTTTSIIHYAALPLQQEEDTHNTTPHIQSIPAGVQQ